MSWSYVAAGAISQVTSGNMIPGLPAGWQANDLHVCVIATRDNVNSTMPGGWTALNAGANAGVGLRHTSYYRRAQGGDAAPTVTHAAGSYGCAIIVGYRGIVTSDPPTDVVGSTFSNTSSATLVFHDVGITTTVSNDLALCLGGVNWDNVYGTYTGSPTPTERVDLPGTEVGPYPELVVADFNQATAGSTGARSATAGFSAALVGQLVSFKEAATSRRKIVVVS